MTTDKPKGPVYRGGIARDDGGSTWSWGQGDKAYHRDVPAKDMAGIARQGHAMRKAG